MFWGMEQRQATRGLMPGVCLLLSFAADPGAVERKESPVGSAITLRVEDGDQCTAPLASDHFQRLIGADNAFVANHQSFVFALVHGEDVDQM